MIFIVNTGGTLNKKYNKISGKLYVPKDNTAIEKIMSLYKDIKYTIKGIIYKDSLDILDTDREILVQTVLKSNADKILIIHGTDTIDKTANFLDKKIKNKLIILTGAMKPFEIDNTEAIINIAMSYGFMQSSLENGIYICMSGMVEHFKNITKNKQKGVFEKKSFLE